VPFHGNAGVGLRDDIVYEQTEYTADEISRRLINKARPDALLD
jgi:hypothetical protein